MYHLALFPSYLFQKLHFFCYFFPLPSARAMLHVQLNLLDILLVDRRGNQASDSIGHSLGYASSKYSGECLFCLLSYLVLLSLLSAFCLELCLASHLLPSLTFSSYLITPLLPSISVPSSSLAFLLYFLPSFLPSFCHSFYLSPPPLPYLPSSLFCCFIPSFLPSFFLLSLLPCSYSSVSSFFLLSLLPCSYSSVTSFFLLSVLASLFLFLCYFLLSVLASLFLFLCFFLLSSFRACFLTSFVSCILESQYSLNLITSSYYITPLLFSEGKGCIVDSGTTDTYLPREFLEKFSEIFEV